MNGYIAIYNSKEKEIYAETLYAAKLQAIKEFKVPKSKEHRVVVMLCEKDGEQVVHDPLF